MNDRVDREINSNEAYFPAIAYTFKNSFRKLNSPPFPVAEAFWLSYSVLSWLGRQLKLKYIRQDINADLLYHSHVQKNKKSSNKSIPAALAYLYE